MATTIHDVARVAGVSISTVSYALSGKRAIGENTRRRVQEAVTALDYRPNAGARALAGRRTYILAVTEPLRPDTYTSAHMAFVLASATAARKFDYDVLLLTQDEATGGLQRVTSSHTVDGVIVLDVLAEDERADLLRRLNVPAAFVGVPDNTDGLVCIDLDFEAAARLAVDHLVGDGHTVIGLLGQSAPTYERGSNFAIRLRDAFIDHGRTRGVEVRSASPGRTADSIDSAVTKLLGPARDLTGIVMHCEDTTQRRALDLLAKAGLKIPRDLSVISAASVFDTSGFTPPLDAIPLLPEESCSRAVELILAQMDGPVDARVELMPPTYVNRGSTGPRPT